MPTKAQARVNKRRNTRVNRMKAAAKRNKAALKAKRKKLPPYLTTA